MRRLVAFAAGVATGSAFAAIVAMSSLKALVDYLKADDREAPNVWPAAGFPPLDPAAGQHIIIRREESKHDQ